MSHLESIVSVSNENGITRYQDIINSMLINAVLSQSVHRQFASLAVL